MKILIGEAYISDDVWHDTVITTEKHQPVDPELVAMMYRNVRETETTTNYKPDDLFEG